MKWLITGGCGVIGTSLIKNLDGNEGHSIRVIDNLSVGTRDDLSTVCTFKENFPDELSLVSSQVQLIIVRIFCIHIRHSRLF